MLSSGVCYAAAEFILSHESLMVPIRNHQALNRFPCTHCDEAQPSRVAGHSEACESHLEPIVGRGPSYLDVSSLRNVLHSYNAQEGEP